LTAQGVLTVNIQLSYCVNPGGGEGGRERERNKSETKERGGGGGECNGEGGRERGHKIKE
jgi:hypothetical protein